MRRVYKNVCLAKISASIMAANMWKNSLKNVESYNNEILYETLLDFLQRNGTYLLNKPRKSLAIAKTPSMVFRTPSLSVVCTPTTISQLHAFQFQGVCILRPLTAHSSLQTCAWPIRG